MESDHTEDKLLEALSLDEIHTPAPNNFQLYQYEPLQSASHIRLLAFSFPGKSESFGSGGSLLKDDAAISIDEAELDIITVDLREQPVYRALSYVWTDNPSTVEIKLKGGRKIVVTTSLQETLTRAIWLRENNMLEKLPLWIDQICINQTDLEERCQQVSMMGTIYLSADHVLAWLGEPNEDLTPSFMHLIAAFRRRPDDGRTWAASQALMKEKIELEFDPEKPTLKAKRFLAVQEVLNRPWFQRAWVFQEAVLPKQVKMVIGRYLFYFPELYNLVNHILTIQYAINGYRGSIGKTGAGFESMQSIHDFRAQWLQKKEPRAFLKFLCRAGGNWKATEPRDMVYAFLGLLNKPGLFTPLDYTINPNYSASLRDVYIALTRTIMDGSRNLDIFAKTIGDEPLLEPKEMRMSETLPSWVPDWGVETAIVMPIHNSGDNSFDACKGYSYVPVPSPPEVLIVKGKIITQIECAINHPFHKHYFMNADRGWLSVDFHYEEMISFGVPGTAHSVTRERVLKTLLADGAVVWPFRTVTPETPSNFSDERVRELLHAYDMWPQIAAGDTDFPNFEKVKDDLHELQQRSLIVQRKRLVGTRDGNMALVPRACLLYDDCKIAILHGSKVPVVMVEGVEGTNEWHLMGQCYVESAMFGELVDWKEDEGEIFKIV